MSLAKLLEGLHDDASRLERAQRQLVREPNDQKLQVAIAALSKRVSRARSAMSLDASANQIDVLQYRIINEFEKYSVSGVAEGLVAFQDGFTAIYDAIVNGPRERARYSNEILSETEFQLGYTYPGSFGFVLAIDSSRNLFDSKFDASVDAIADFLSIRDEDDAIECSRNLGLAATSRMYKWVSINSSFCNSVDYQWQLSSDVVKGQVVEVNRFSELKEIFEAAQDLEANEFEVSSTLVGIDMERLSFHLVTGEGESLKGTIADSVSTGEYLVPHTYVAKIRQETKIYPATGEKKMAYFLVNLSDDL